MARAVGIDLGTTNSCVSVLEGGEPTVVASSATSGTGSVATSAPADVNFGADSVAVPDDLSGWSGFGEVGTADRAGPTASPCVVTGKACLIYTTQTTGTGMP